MNLVVRGQPILAVYLFHAKQKSMARLPKTVSSRKAGKKEKSTDGPWFAGILFSMDRLHHYKCLYLFRFTSVVTEG